MSVPAFSISDPGYLNLSGKKGNFTFLTENVYIMEVDSKIIVVPWDFTPGD